jgi:DNA-binding response OmpR family regulator
VVNRDAQTTDDEDVTAIHVLVVDDEPDILELLSIWLGGDSRCASVATAATLDEALKAVHEHPIDAVLLDFFLGHQLCVEGLPAIRRARPDAHIAVYTASRRAAHDSGVLNAGADLIIEKGSASIDTVIDTLLAGITSPARLT